MVRTASIFVLAGMLAVLAIFLPRLVEVAWTPAPPPDPSPDPVVDPVAEPPPPAMAGETGHRFSLIRGGLELTGALSAGHVLQGSSDETWMAVTVRALEAPEAAVRRPVNVALVLDRSGSMAGEKLIGAKAAARALVHRLGPQDRMTLVAYGSSVSVLAKQVAGTEQGKQTLLRAIAGIEDFGGTFLSGGLEAARKALAAGSGPGTVTRLLLLSDGEANEGIVEPAGLRRLAGKLASQGISISAIGVGTEFNEDVLLALADRSGGRYHYLRSPAALAQTLEQELGAARSAVAREVALRVRTENGTEVRQVYGWPASVDADGATLRLPDLAPGEVHRVMLRLGAPTDRSGPANVAHVHLSYLEERAGDLASLQHALRHTITPSASQAEASLQRDVLEMAARARAAEGLDEAARLYDRGQVDQAREVMRRRIEEVLLRNRKVIQSDTLEAEVRQFESRARFPAGAPHSEEGRDAVKRLKSQALEFSR